MFAVCCLLCVVVGVVVVVVVVCCYRLLFVVVVAVDVVVDVSENRLEVFIPSSRTETATSTNNN